jgi:hypothetical protein
MDDVADVIIRGRAGQVLPDLVAAVSIVKERERSP